MKLIEAMKRVKLNHAKIDDLKERIARHSAHYENELAPYGADTRGTIESWVQSAIDLGEQNIQLLTRIAQTNQQTMVTIEIGGRSYTRPISEWIWRRREYAALDRSIYASLSDKGLKNKRVTNSVTGEAEEIGVVLNYDTANRDEKMMLYMSEPHLIDSTLEVVNAVTDLVKDEY